MQRRKKETYLLKKIFANRKKYMENLKQNQKAQKKERNKNSLQQLFSIYLFYHI